MSIKLFLKQTFKKIMKSIYVIKTVSFFIFIYSKLIGKSVKWQYIGVNEIKENIGSDNAIWVSWHARTAMMPFFWQKFFNRKMAALVSPHQYGQIIANFLKWYNITPVNGSTNENARQSALELMRHLLSGYDLFISPDGPRGPRMRMKKSPIYYAQKTGKPIICACFSLKKVKIVEKAWDKTMIPFPFTSGAFVLSDPLYVPEKLTDEEFEAYRKKLENIANNLAEKCDKSVGITPIQPADENDFKRKR